MQRTSDADTALELFAFRLMEWMPIRNRCSLVINSMVLGEPIRFHYCSRKLNMQVLAREM